MALQNFLGPINLEATQQELLAEAILLLSKLVNGMPRLDVNNRVLVNTAEVTTVALVTQMQNFGSSGKATDGIPSQTSNMGALHIYNNIVVS